MMNNLFKPNEFYMMMGITRETMRHYVDKGLISPAYTNEKGYSFYGEREALQMMIIRYYRSCDLPVESMKDFLWHMDLSDQVNELDQTIHSLDEQICRLQKKKQLLLARRRVMHESGTYLNQPFLHEDGHIIPGLYMAGFDALGWSGSSYFVDITTLGWMTASGYMAGRSVVNYLVEN